MSCCWDLTNTADRSLFEKLVEEQINIFGVTIEYWRVDRDGTKDDLYNTDTKPLISAKYSMKASGSTFDETFTLSRFGIESPDEYEYLITKSAFESVAGDGEVPYEGDFIYVSFQERIFQIAEVKDDTGIFLQNKFLYKLIVRPADISGEEVTNNIGIDDWEAETSEIDDTDTIDSLDDDIVVTKTGDISPFGDWE